MKKIIHRFLSVALGGVVMAALAGCATVDLGPEYDAPQVRFPGQTAAPAPTDQAVPEDQQATPAQVMPVGPNSAIARAPLPADSGADVVPPGSSDSDNLNPSAMNTPASDSGLSNTGASASDSHLVTLTTRLDGASAMPPSNTGAWAQLDAVYDSNTRLLRWKVTWNNLSSPITDVRFYGPASPGQQGPATLIWPGPFGSWYEGRATLAPQQATDLVGGRWYVNVRTESYPGGEIRGQLRVVY